MALDIFPPEAPRNTPGKGSNKPEARWDYTQALDKKLAPGKFVEEKEGSVKDMPTTYQGRHVIGRDTEINKGVYVTANDLGEFLGEAIVVDDEKQPRLRESYEEFKKRLQKKSNSSFQRLANRVKGKENPISKTKVLDEVLVYAQEEIPYDLKTTNEIIATQKPGQKVSLDTFIYEGAGVCRHQALLGGYLLQEMKKDGFVGGDASVDRNYVPGEGGHAWIRYTNSRGEVYIVDPANNYIGPLNSAKARWFYERPTDKKST